MTVSYIPFVPEDQPEKTPTSKWSQGIAMFAAFVIPFVLLLTSARYRVFMAQANHRLQVFSQSTLSGNPVSAEQLQDVKFKNTNGTTP